MYEPWTLSELVPVEALVKGVPYKVLISAVWARDEQALYTTASLAAGLGIIQLQEFIEAKKCPLSTPEPGQAKLPPGYHRMQCPDCEETWDAWVDEEGSLEDPRDAYCTTPDCQNLGKLANLLE